MIVNYLLHNPYPDKPVHFIVEYCCLVTSVPAGDYIQLKLNLREEALLKELRVSVDEDWISFYETDEISVEDIFDSDGKSALKA